MAYDGQGIPAEKRDVVLDHGFTTTAEGTGLGMSIVIDVDRAHGWDVDVVASEDGGARFEISGLDIDAPGEVAPTESVEPQ